MITEISDSILESEKEPALFELAFKIYYSESDYAVATVWTYLRPKSNDLQMTLSPRRQGKGARRSNDVLASVDEPEPVFIGALTSDYLFRLASSALKSSHRS